MSFNIRYSPVSVVKEMEGLAGAEITEPPLSAGKITGAEDPYVYLFEWNEYLAPRALYALQDAGVVTKVATKTFSFNNPALKHDFSYGTILVPASGQQYTKSELKKLVESIAKDCRITVYGVSTGFTESGMDLGSSNFIVLEKPSVVMIVGDGISSSDAGEIWHLLDTRYKMPVTMITASRFASIDLEKYNVLIVAGSPDISNSVVENIRTWNRRGGAIIGYEGGNQWLSRNKLADIEFVPAPSSKLKEGIYADRSVSAQARQIPGTIFETRLDLTHPLCYGFTRDRLPVFKIGIMVAKKDANIYNNPVMYTSSPLLSGYCTKDNLEIIKGAPFASVHGSRIISLYDNTNLRAIWYGTNKIFLNALFFGQLMGRSGYEYGD
jgi:hypothetical protein